MIWLSILACFFVGLSLGFVLGYNRGRLLAVEDFDAILRDIVRDAMESGQDKSITYEVTYESITEKKQ